MLTFLHYNLRVGQINFDVGIRIQLLYHELSDWGMNLYEILFHYKLGD